MKFYFFANIWILLVWNNYDENYEFHMWGEKNEGLKKGGVAKTVPEKILI